MRLQYLLLLLFPSLSLAQTMLESTEWCGRQRAFPSKGLLNNLNDGRSDSIDILKTTIELDLRNTPGITATCALHLAAKVDGIQEIRLDLEALSVDKVSWTGPNLLSYSQSGHFLQVELAQTMNTGDTTTITVFYHGVPPTDASGWGGYYNTSGYTFNLGVGFAADPHSYGRAWFPCFDNFVERCAFSVGITTPPSKPGYGNGVLTLEDIQPSFVYRRWTMEDEIPAYLACFASGPYTSFKRTYPGETGPVAVEIAAAVADTNKVRNTFVHLPEAIQAYEYWFGPFQWDKIGYSLVPFNSGAMEHATNIAIGRAYIDGSLNYETLWAHELSHHWWGDLATCSTAEDMWLNEGWASYSEHLITEKLYGKTAYQNAVRANHLNILQTAHLSEGGYLAVSGVPHDLTYGTHVYKKGASVAHNLRGYLGDSLFRVGCRAALSQTSFDDWSSAEFRDKLEAATGKNLHHFFDDWVFAGGYPDYSVDYMEVIFSPIDAPTIAHLQVKQKLRGAPHFHHNVPLEFRFLMGDGSWQYHTGIVSGETTQLEFFFPAFGPAPVAVFVNTRLKILQARSEGEKWVKNTGASNFSEAKFNVTVNSLGADSVFFRVEHHFASPDNAGANPNGYALSNRYWSVLSSGKTFPSGFDAQAIVIYDGRGQWDELDNELFEQTSPSEDSILLLYRPGAGFPWQEWSSYTKLTLGSANDTYGQLRPTHLAPGEYTIGKGTPTNAARTPDPLGKVLVSPNPVQGKLRIQAGESFDQVTLIGSDGQTEKTWNFPGVLEAELDLGGLSSGSYWVLLSGKKGSALRSVIKQ